MLFEVRRLGYAYFIHIGVRNLVYLVLYKCYQICYRHSFVELGDGVRYYDTDGLGLLLQVENGEKVVGDGSGNKMYFDAEGRLIKTISCYSEYLVKYFSYNDRGQLITIYDGRTPNNVISLS